MWLERVVEKSVWCQEEGIEKEKKKHWDSTSISDHRGDCIGTMSMETQGDKTWKEEKLSDLQGLKARQMCEMNCDLESTS